MRSLHLADHHPDPVRVYCEACEQEFLERETATDSRGDLHCPHCDSLRLMQAHERRGGLRRFLRRYSQT